jgi:hypothetical protein
LRLDRDEIRGREVLLSTQQNSKNAKQQGVEPKDTLPANARIFVTSSLICLSNVYHPIRARTPSAVSIFRNVFASSSQSESSIRLFLGFI